MQRLLSLILILAASACTGAAQVSVVFFDVGHGDAIYISLPQNVDILIDAGRSAEHGSRVASSLVRDGYVEDGRIEFLFITHYDTDHFRGLGEILNVFSVGTVISPGVGTPDELLRWISEVESVGGTWLRVLGDTASVSVGATWDFSTAVLTLLGPVGSYRSHNNNSLVLQLETPGFSVLFMGDAEEAAELDLVQVYGPGLQSTFLKVGHHGSRMSTTCTLLSVVDPRTAVISAPGTADHPHVDTLRWLAAFGVSVYQTSTHGIVTIRDDGTVHTENGGGPRVDLPEADGLRWQALCPVCLLNTGEAGDLRLHGVVGAAREEALLQHRTHVGVFRFAGCLEDIPGIAATLRDRIIQGLCGPE